MKRWYPWVGGRPISWPWQVASQANFDGLRSLTLPPQVYAGVPALRCACRCLHADISAAAWIKQIDKACTPDPQRACPKRLYLYYDSSISRRKIAMSVPQGKLPVRGRRLGRKPAAAASTAIAVKGRRRTPPKASATPDWVALSYSGHGVIEYARRVARATPLEIIEIERGGVRSRLLKDLAAEMELPTQYIYRLVGVAKATAEKKITANEMISGSAGHATLGLVKLLGIAQGVVDQSTAEGAKGFDTERWLGQWIQRPQPALNGKTPAEFLDTPTGVDLVARLLGALESGAYQ